MRYNDYLNDPLSKDDNGNPEPGNGISSRYDLRTGKTRKCFGGFDNKIGHYNRKTKEYTSHFISSPTNTKLAAWVFPDVSELYCPRRGLETGPYNHDWVVENIKKNW